MTVTLFASLVVPSAASSGLQCDGEIATIVGTEGRDVIVGTDGPDVIVGLGMGDVISGGAGDDVMCGGRGQDDLDGGAGNDRIFGQRNRYFAGGEYPDTLDGGPGDDLMDGGQGGGDTVVFSWARSGVTVDARQHTADGTSSGHDQVFRVGKVWGSRHDDTILHVWTVNAGGGDDVVRDVGEAFGGDGNDRIVASRDFGYLHGGNGADILRGRGGPDVLWGEDGADFLDGGPGDDTGDGGLETDTCVEIETRISCELEGPRQARTAARRTASIEAATS